MLAQGHIHRTPRKWYMPQPLVVPARSPSARSPLPLRFGSRAACLAGAFKTTRALPQPPGPSISSLPTPHPAQKTSPPIHACGDWSTTRQRLTCEWRCPSGLYARADGGYTVGREERKDRHLRRATRHGGLAPESLLDGAHTHTHGSFSGGRMNRRHSTAPQREGCARLTSIHSVAYIHRCPNARRIRARPVMAHVPRDDDSRRSQRRPQSTTSLFGSAVLRELVILDVHRSLLHHPAPRPLRPPCSHLAATSPADAPAAVHGRLCPKARRGRGWTWWRGRALSRSRWRARSTRSWAAGGSGDAVYCACFLSAPPSLR
jgi:hypothetical protein